MSETHRLGSLPVQRAHAVLHAPPTGAPYAPAWLHVPAPRPIFTARAETPQALYVVVAFALMLVLATAAGVFGSVAALALVDADEAPAAPLVEEASPAAVVGR